MKVPVDSVLLEPLMSCFQSKR